MELEITTEELILLLLLLLFLMESGTNVELGDFKANADASMTAK